MKYRKAQLRWLVAGIVSLGFAATAQAADIAYKAVPQDAPLSQVFWLGADFKKNADAGYGGGIYKLDGNLSTAGFLVRAQGLYAGFDYPTALGPTNGKGSISAGSGSIGYQTFGSGLVASGFVGVDYQKYSFNPTVPAALQLNDTVGAIFTGRVATVGNDLYSASAEGSFSTANNSYYARVQPGLRFGNLTVGPEAVGLGSRTYDEYRLGGFASYDFSKNFALKFDGGYSKATRNTSSIGIGSSGGYGGLTLVFLR